MANDDRYDSLRRVLNDAVGQAAVGKGAERHAEAGERFEDQQICEITRRLAGNPAAGALFQVVKKVYESGRLPRDRAIAELHGAINYLGAAIIVLEEKAEPVKAAHEIVLPKVPAPISEEAQKYYRDLKAYGSKQEENEGYVSQNGTD